MIRALEEQPTLSVLLVELKQRHGSQRRPGAAANLEWQSQKQEEIGKLAASSNAKLVERRRSTTTLERLFLDATKEDAPANAAKKRE